MIVVMDKMSDFGQKRIGKRRRRRRRRELHASVLVDMTRGVVLARK